MYRNAREFFAGRFPQRPTAVSDEEWAIFSAYVRDGKTQVAIAREMGIPLCRVPAAVACVWNRAASQVLERRCPCCNGTGVKSDQE